MGEHSRIEWTDATWNTVYGCTRASEGCDNCYAVRQTQRLAGTLEAAQGLVNPGKRHFNGTVRCLPERLDWPLRKKKPLRIFVNSLSDLFHPTVPDDFIASVWRTMALAHWHTFQVLTKRPERARDLLTKWNCARFGVREVGDNGPNPGGTPMPLPNVWPGTSVENQDQMWRVNESVDWVSAEPLLGPLDFGERIKRLKWVVVGGESGPNARPMHPDWVRSIRDQCQAAGVPFLFKQWGAWVSPGVPAFSKEWHQEVRCIRSDGTTWRPSPQDENADAITVVRVGKKAAGRELDGKVWDEFPTTEGS